jgi:hypothetical protein
MERVRLLKLFGSLLVFGLFASSCVVSDGDDDDECDPGTSSSCTCADGSTGTRTCLPTGSGWAACSACSGASGGSGGSAGNGGSGGQSSGGSNAGAGEGGTSTGGSASGGEGGASTGGSAGGGAGEGGTAGGGGGDADPCDECAKANCEPEWDACEVDGASSQCAQEFNCIAGCMKEARASLTGSQLLSADEITMTCVLDVCDDVIPSGGWNGGPTPETHDLLDCLAGKTGWEGPPPHWDQSPCRNACFGPLD